MLKVLNVQMNSFSRFVFNAEQLNLGFRIEVLVLHYKFKKCLGKQRSNYLQMRIIKLGWAYLLWLVFVLCSYIKATESIRHA